MPGVVEDLHCSARCIESNATRDQLQLLSVTENYLMETFQLSFGVIASE